MECREAQELIGGYVDDDLSQETRRRLERHLLRCRGCAWEAESQRITCERLREGIGEVTASDAFRVRVLLHLRRDNPHLAPTGEPETADVLQYRLPMAL